MKKLKGSKDKILLFGFGLLFLGYLFLIGKNFEASLNNISSIFGYVDYQHNWRGLEEFLSLRIPFKDYFYEYGWFFLAIQSLGYLIFGRNFLAVLISMFWYMPVVGVMISYLIARNVLAKKLLVLVFLFFLLLFGTNYNYNSARHLVAELSLSFFILYLFKSKTKHLLLAGIIGGLAVLTALEYGIALNIALFLIFLFSFFSKTKLKNYFFNKFFLGQLLVLFPYFAWLYLNKALTNYWQFTFGFINNFYYASPCSSHSFPRLSEIESLRSVSKLLVFNFPLEFLQRVNLYLVFAFFIIVGFSSFIFFIKKRNFSCHDLAKLSLVIYGLLISIRTLDSPCLGYFSYSLAPFFLLVTLLVEKVVFLSWRKKRTTLRAVGTFGVVIVFAWFILTENTGYVVEIFGKKEKPSKKETDQKEFYSPVGWFLEKDLVEKYQEIADYIMAHSTADDFLYVYPWGPYNNLTGRKPPNSFTNLLQVSIAGQHFMGKARRELVTKKPRLIVVNLYNNLGIVRYGRTRGDVGRYFCLADEEGPVFAGEGNQIERFILENYEVALKNDLAVVMQPRAMPLVIGEKKKEVFSWENWREEEIDLHLMEKTDSPERYTILSQQASWTLVFKEPLKVSDLAIRLKLNGDLLTRHLTRYFLNFYIILADTKETVQVAKELAWKDWQTIKIPLGTEQEMEGLKIRLGANSGLIWWLKPSFLAVRKVVLYQFLD